MSNIFRDYDIRGRVPRDLNPEIARAIGGHFVNFVRKRMKKRNPSILVARDLRATSEGLATGFIEGAVTAGGRMAYVGALSYPEAAFQTLLGKSYDAGAYITASHDPVDYNGFKLMLRGVGQIGKANGLLELEKSSKPSVIKGGAWLSVTPKTREYREALLKIIPRLRPKTILVDAASGAAAASLPIILASYPLLYKPIFFDPKAGSHPLNPLDPTVDGIIKKHWPEGAALGFVFDADGDRLAVFSRGERIRQDVIFALLAIEILKERPGASFVYDVTHGTFLRPLLEAYGGKLYVSKVGRPHIQKEMARRKALLGGELSGHIYHHDFFDTDSATLSMLKVMRAADSLGESLNSFSRSLTSSVLAQKNFVSRQDQARVLALAERLYQNHITSRLDGTTVQYPTWWFNIRASNTEENLFRLTIEAESAHMTKEKVTILKKELKL